MTLVPVFPPVVTIRVLWHSVGKDINEEHVDLDDLISGDGVAAVMKGFRLKASIFGDIC
jgi:hypothetical protein